MAKSRVGLQFEGWEEYIAKLDKLGGSSAIKQGVNAGLRSSKKHINPKIINTLQSGLPAGGKYTTGATKRALNSDMNVSWSGAIGEIKIGFDIKKPGGVTSIFLIKGTPRMRPARGLKAAIYGSKTKKEIAKIQEQEVAKVIKRIMGG